MFSYDGIDTMGPLTFCRLSIALVVTEGYRYRVILFAQEVMVWL